MRKILFSACCNTYTQQKTCEGLIKLLKDGRYQVDMAGDVAKEMWLSYNLAFAFNRRGYEKIQTLRPAIPIVYSILADDYEDEFIEDATQYEHCCSSHRKKLIPVIVVLQLFLFRGTEKWIGILNIRILSLLFLLEWVMGVRH